MGSPTTQRFAVFRHPENPPESWRSWSAYTRDFNTAWRGFVGFYEGHGATRRERKADAIKRARADNRDPMDGIAPTPPAPADAKCNAPGCSVCAAGLPHTTHSYPMTAPAPADDARERGLAAYDALTMQEQSEISAQHPRYCYAKGYVAALAGRADDASGAEAMGIPGLDFQPPRDRTPNGYTRVEAYMGQGHVVVMGYPTDESHSCDALGCGSTGAHVIARLPLPATDDAVEEARRAFCEAARLVAAHNVAVAVASVASIPDHYKATKARDDAVTTMQRAYSTLIAAERDAALRRAKESRSDDSRPASGQGGA